MLLPLCCSHCADLLTVGQLQVALPIALILIALVFFYIVYVVNSRSLPKLLPEYQASGGSCSYCRHDADISANAEASLSGLNWI